MGQPSFAEEKSAKFFLEPWMILSLFGREAFCVDILWKGCKAGGSHVAGIHRPLANTRFQGIFALGCTAADLYLIVINHFHYTVDVIMAIILTFLLYTNAGLAAVMEISLVSIVEGCSKFP